MIQRADQRSGALRLLSTSIVAIVGIVLTSATQLFGQPASPDDTVYLFSTFTEPEQDGLRFAYSFDGYHWSNVPGLFLRAQVGGKIMRDPSIVRGPDGTFHMVWTSAWRGDQGFGYASSRDLVHWSEQKFIPVMAHEPTTVNVWAPELYYDDVEDRFIICWASTIPGRFPDYLEERNNNHRMYYTTTRDFKSFTPTKLFLEPDFSVIDCQILKDDGRYVLLLKDNTRPHRNIRVAFGDSPLGPWRDISEHLTAHLTEGPSALKIGEDWFIYYEAYDAKHYSAMKTRDFKTFTDVTDQMTFPQGLKHGTAFKATRRDLDRLLRFSREPVSEARLPLASPVSGSEMEKRLAEIERVANRGPFKPDWESLKQFKAPQWYHDAKLGIFIHWGVYSVPAFANEWYPRNMYRTNSREFQHHVKTYGPASEFGYKDFIPMFKAEKFNAREWAKLFRDAGAKYVVPVAEHHDGFPMYDSAFTDWSAAKMGPRRDVLGDLAKAFRREGLIVGASSHRAEHWWYFDQGMLFASDVRDTSNAGLYGPAASQRLAENQSVPPDKEFLDDWLLRSCEIVDKYRPQVVYFDWWIGQPVFQPYLKTFAAYYYNRGAEWKKGVAINFKRWEGESFPEGTGVFDVERGQLGEIQPSLWQTCNSVSRSSWGYVTNHNYKSAGDIIDEFVDIVSKNGALLLNIGPKADGTIPEREQEILRELGAWLKVNGEAIYGTRPWTHFGEGPTEVVAGPFSDSKRRSFTAEDFRFTRKGNILYAVALAWPENGRLVVRSLGRTALPAGGTIKEVRLLGHKGRIQWEQTAEGLIVKLPQNAPCDHAVTLRIAGLNP
jgi:alpha-L-fucosidase